MNLSVERNRFLSVQCEPGERIVFDRVENRYHLLRQAAASLWEEIGEGGSFDVVAEEPSGADSIGSLARAGLVRIDPEPAPHGIPRRVWLSRTSKATAVAVVLPLVATVAAPSLGLAQYGPSVMEEASTESTTEETSSSGSSSGTRERRRSGERTRPRSGEVQPDPPPSPETEGPEVVESGDPEETLTRRRRSDPAATDAGETDDDSESSLFDRIGGQEHWSERTHWSRQAHWSEGTGAADD